MLSKQVQPRLSWVYPKYTSIFFGIIIFFMFFTLKPFEFHSMDLDDLLLSCVLISVLASITYWILFSIFKTNILRSWVYWKDVLFANAAFLLFAIMNFLSFYLLDKIGVILVEDETLLFTESIEYSFKIGWFLYFLVLFIEDVLKRLNTPKEIKHRMERLDVFKSSESNTKLITLVGLNNDECLRIDSSLLLFMKSEGNYVQVNYINGAGVIVSEIIRNSLKNICDQLHSYDFFYCSHRSYVVNLNYITDITGNNKSKQIIVSATNKQFKIPISRLKISEFDELISSR